ncbi:hypothetical protein GIB67_009188 [Kingdonia uniflora]|uniref:Uncharacterized protein n=1 Tax=Kingdonia uniflora TaxID=39325 RepID=A0A7J7N278_9MAGN|nr:hypothetical protein GIB67_009188 [Kingdonia uniflora]
MAEKLGTFLKLFTLVHKHFRCLHLGVFKEKIYKEVIMVDPLEARLFSCKTNA